MHGRTRCAVIGRVAGGCVASFVSASGPVTKLLLQSDGPVPTLLVVLAPGLFATCRQSCAAFSFRGVEVGLGEEGNSRDPDRAGTNQDAGCLGREKRERAPKSPGCGLQRAAGGEHEMRAGAMSQRVHGAAGFLPSGEGPGYSQARLITLAPVAGTQ